MPPNLTGYYRFVSQKNLEDYLQALSNAPCLLTPSSPFYLRDPLRRGPGVGCWENAWVGSISEKREVSPQCQTYLRHHSQPYRLTPLRLSPPADVNVALRKIAQLLKPDKEIEHSGNHMVVKTLSTFRSYVMEFEVGVEFEEDLRVVDGRKCQVLPWRW